MMENKYKHGILIYLLMFVVTFGHSASNHKPLEAAISPEVGKASTGVLSAMFWPLYWTWLAFDEPKQGDD